MNNPSSKLSVIGGTGFLGKHFVEAMIKKGLKDRGVIFKPLNMLSKFK